MSVTFSVAYDAADTLGYKIGCYCESFDDGRRFDTWEQANDVANVELVVCSDEYCGYRHAQAIVVERPELNVSNSNAFALLSDLGFDMSETDYCGGSVSAREMSSRVENSQLAHDRYTAALVTVVMEASKLGRDVQWC